MSNFSALIATIQAYIKTNGNEEITGAVLQDILEAMVQALGTEAINNLETALGNEETARQNADGTLQNNIDAEALRAGTAEAGLGGRLDTIEAKIPSAASSSNKLADKAFVTNLTDALQAAVNGIKSNIDNGYVYAGIATPAGTPVTGKVFYLTTQAGTYTNFGGLVVTQGINILKYNGTTWSQEKLIGIDDEPKKVSVNTITSGAVSDIEDAVNGIKATDLTGRRVIDVTFESGNIDSGTGEDAPSQTLMRTDYILFTQNMIIDTSECGSSCRIFKYNAEKVYQSSFPGQQRKINFKYVTVGWYVRIVCAKTDILKIYDSYDGVFVRINDGLPNSKIPETFERSGCVFHNTLTWENKTINSRWEEINSPNRLLTQITNYRCTLKCPSGYKLRVFDVPNQIAIDWVTEVDTTRFVSDELKVSVAREDDIPIYPEEGKFIAFYSPYMEGKNVITELSTHHVTFKNGYLSALDGSSGYSQKRLISDLIILLPEVSITVADGYQLRAYLFNEKYELLSATDWKVNHRNITGDYSRVILMVRKTDSSAIKPASVYDPEDPDYPVFVGGTQSWMNGYYDVGKLFKDAENEGFDESCFNLMHHGTEGMSGAYFWNYPKLIHVNDGFKNAVYFGYVTEYGNSGVCCYDIDKDKYMSVDLFKSAPDDHDDMVCIYYELRKRMFAFGFQHNKETFIRVYRSCGRYNNLYFQWRNNIVFDEFVTYVQAFEQKRYWDNEKSRFVLFVRVNAKSWYVVYSKDDIGVEWEEPIKLFDTTSVEGGVQLYIAARPTTTEDVLQLVVYGNPHWDKYSDTRIRLCYYNIGTREITDVSGTVLGTAGDGIDYSEIPVIIDGCAVGKYADIPNYNDLEPDDKDLSLIYRLYDAAPNCDVGYPAIAYAKTYKHEYVLGEYWIYQYGESKKVCNYGSDLYPGGNGDIGPGICFIGERTDRVILGRSALNISSNNYMTYLEKWILQNADTGWVKEGDPIDSVNSDNIRHRIIRPITDAEGDYLMYQKGRMLVNETDDVFSFEAIVTPVNDGSST